MNVSIADIYLNRRQSSRNGPSKRAYKSETRVFIGLPQNAVAPSSNITHRNPTRSSDVLKTGFSFQLATEQAISRYHVGAGSCMADRAI